MTMNDPQGVNDAIGLTIGKVRCLSGFHLLSASLFFPDRAASEFTVPQPSAAVSPPNGLVVVLENRPGQDRLDLQSLNNPSISGVALQIRWRDIEPAQEKPDWSKLDQLFAAAESSHKWVQLLIFPGFFSPPWAVEGAQTEMFPIQYGPGKGTLMRLPLPWDRVYLAHWFDFLKLLSAKYAASPAFRVIAAAGPTSVSAEFTLRNCKSGGASAIPQVNTSRRGKRSFKCMRPTFPINMSLCRWDLV
jgi:hypothetical protein